jgi:hypothetical protein
MRMWKRRRERGDVLRVGFPSSSLYYPLLPYGLSLLLSSFSPLVKSDPLLEAKADQKLMIQRIVLVSSLLAAAYCMPRIMWGRRLQSNADLVKVG